MMRRRGDRRTREMVPRRAEISSKFRIVRSFRYMPRSSLRCYYGPEWPGLREGSVAVTDLIYRITFIQDTAKSRTQ